jgi:hypothetical protein
MDRTRSPVSSESDTLARPRRNSNANTAFLSPTTCEQSPNYAPVFEYLVRRIVAWCAGDATAGMRTRPAHIKAFDWCAVVTVAKNRSCSPELIEAHVPVHDITADQTEFAF